MQDKMEQLAEQLSKQHIEHVFGITGSGPTWKLLTALESRGVTYHPVVHEAAGAIMAGAVAKQTGKTAVSLSIKGPGFANMLPGMIANYFECRPALSISEAYDSNAPLRRVHKRIDQQQIASPFVKGLISLDQIGRLDNLLSYSLAEQQGPVHLELSSQEIDGETDFEHHKPDAIDCTDVVAKISSFEKPVVILGSLAGRRAWGALFNELDIPVFTTVAGKGVIDEAFPHAAGIYTGAGKSLVPERHLLEEADGIISIGLRFNELLGFSKYPQFHVYLDETDTDASNAFEADKKLTGNLDSCIETLVDALKKKSWGQDSIAALRRQLSDALLSDTWLPAGCFAAMNNLSYDYSLVLDTGSFCTVGEHVWIASGKRKFTGSSNGRNMGIGLPTAMGLSVADPSTPVLYVTGDGGIRLYIAEMKMAVEQKMPLCVILMSDGKYGSIACAQPPGVHMTQSAVVIRNPSWLGAMAGMGVEAEPVSNYDQLQSRLESWDRKKPLYLEAAFDASAYAVMTKDLRD